MKLSRNKLIYFSIIASVLIFIIAYGVSVFTPEVADQNLVAPKVPESTRKESQFEDRLEAIDHIKKDRELHLPELYELEEDTLKDFTELDFLQDTPDLEADPGITVISESETDHPLTEASAHDKIESSSLERSDPIFSSEHIEVSKEVFFKAVVYSNQEIRSGDRLKLFIPPQARSLSGTTHGQMLYGICKVNGNRVHIEVLMGDGQRWIAYDPQDHGEGIYVRNRKQPKPANRLAGEVSTEIQIPGVPLLPRLRNLFIQPNRGGTIQFYDQFEFTLKPML